MPHAEVTLPGESSSVPTARRFVESILSSWGQPEHGWSAALIISELAANCTLHARTSFTVSVLLADGEVRLQVRDGSRRAPAIRDYGTSATTGRGMRLVQDLSSDWGVDLREDGKAVWVVLREQPATDDDQLDEDADLDALLASFGESTLDEVPGAKAWLSWWPLAA